MKADEMLLRHFIFLLFASLFDQIESLNVKGRIVDGNKVIYGQYPWYVLLKKPGSTKSICGGSIISTQWVLTSSQCLKSSPSVLLTFGAITFNDSNALNMTSSMLYIHSYLNAALIKLPEPLIFNKRIQAIELPPENFKKRNLTDEIVEISGFGFSGDSWEDHKTDRLKYTTIRLTGIDECRTWDDYDFVCAKNEKSTGSICDGDMGGPMTWWTEDGRPIQIAIISTSPKFCDWPDPLLYVRLTNLLTWIKELTGIHGWD